jgi:hypothetical protein
MVPTGYEGRLSAGDHENVPVRVFERGGTLLLVVMLAADSEELEPALAEPVRLEYSTAQGLVRVEGAATADEPDLLRLEPGPERDVVQRREFVRIDVSQMVRLIDREGYTIASTHALDVSGGGMRLRGLEELEEGAELTFVLEVGPGEPSIEGRARVARAAAGERGVVFEEIASADRQRLIRFIFARQRAELASARDRARNRRRLA